jgi:hypothetical protein
MTGLAALARLAGTIELPTLEHNSEDRGQSRWKFP